MCRTYQQLQINLPPDPSDLELSMFKKLKMRLGFPIYIGNFRRLGWTGDLPFYAYMCHEHGLFVSQGYGYDHYLVCPKCHEKSHSPIGGGGASRSSEEVSIGGNTMRAHSVSLPDSSEDKEAPP